ncbi:hypothetical protein [Photobacterium galatheae]|uniref:GP-PDE domain-containing protein n=1 Tax=Photobacterium galatheae TaxID=1654360 RepID=A0A066RU50_9GAMM|nr:hypothetical protein [Photobacterium galatheae]KDM91187.1 hypothetical protein EA58_13645 [Photobacterium galatheae]MCM0150090.1 hypothetical protein [Photobacterium galatheae]
MNPMILLIPALFLFYAIQSFASNHAWLFAHRANSPASVNHAIDDGLNAIEIDITHASEISPRIRCSREEWCAYHRGDQKAYNLSEVLNIANTGTGNNGARENKIGAVWLDIKSGHRSEAEYQSLIHLVYHTLGTGDGTLRKFWGVWPISQLNTVYTEVVRKDISRFQRQQESTFLIEVDSNRDSNTAADTCKTWGIQCGLSAGNPFLGALGTHTGPSWDMNNLNYLSGDIEHKTHINAVFLWTLNWDGPYEDDMVRLLFGHRRYWEYLAGFNWQCGQEGNGVIIGPINSVYAESFCTEDNPNDACSVSMASVYSGPNRLGDRYSDIGQPRNAYASQNAFNCNAYDSVDSGL